MLAALEKPEVRKMLRPISIEEYYKLFGDEKTELIDGMVYYKMPKTALHSAAIGLLLRFFSKLMPDSVRVMSENPVRIQNSEPEPDIAIVKPLVSLADPHPTFAYLIIEISVTTQAFDEAKAELYARGGIPIYWNILPQEKVTVVYSEPDQNKYGKVQRIAFGSELDFPIGETVYKVRLSEILK